MKLFTLFLVGVFFSPLAMASNEEALQKLEAFLSINDQSVRTYQGSVARFPRRGCQLRVSPKGDGLLLTLSAPRRTREFIITASGKTACGQSNQVRALCSDADCCGESLQIDSQVNNCCGCGYETIALSRNSKGNIQAVTVKNSGSMVLHCLF